jgi:ABC-2 type transport system permease protein
VTIESGVLGALALLARSVFVGVAFAGIGAWLAMATGSPEAVQGIFPLLFVLLFLSTMNLPADFIEKEWFRTIAEWNPVSFIIDAMRSLIIDGWEWDVLLPGLAVTLAIFVVFFGLAARALNRRVQRT